MSSCEMDQHEDDKDLINDENDSSSDDEDETDALSKAYDEVMTSISENKYGYDLYVKLIEIAQKLCDLDKIRQSHELFSSVYPLAPEIWLNWLKIEDKLVSTPADEEAIMKMYRRALDDYFSVEIALEYSKFGSKLSNSAEICDEVLSVYALHTTKGGQLFDFWKNFYSEQDLPLSKLDRLTQLFEKELSIPHTGMEESYIEFKLLCEKNNIFDTINWEQIDEKYYKAKNTLLKVLPFEKQLSELDPKYHQERALLYIKYVEEAKEFLPADVLQIVYERMVTSCCLDANCWLKYIEYIETQEKSKTKKDFKNFPVFKQSAVDVNNRALRNCTWNEKIHIKKLQLCEKLKYAKKDIQAILENALEAGFSTPEAYVTLWMEYLTYLRRDTNYENENEIEILRKNFDLCWNSLGTQWGVFADCNCEILQFWGRLEYGPLNNHSKGKELWTTVMESSDNALKSALWIEFAQLEAKYSIDGARKIYQKALEQYNLDHPDIIAAAWLNLERCKGSLKDLLICQDYLNKQCQHLTNQQSNKTLRSKGDRKRKNTVEKPVKDVEEVSRSHKKVRLDKKDDTNLTQKSIITKPESVKDEHENEEIDKSKDHLRIFLSNLSYDITENQIREELKGLEIVNIDIIKSPNGRGRGFGYVELSSEEEVDKALKLDRVMLDGRPVYISKMLRDKEERQKFKYSNTLEPTKLFIKGIPYDSTKEDLEKLFNEFGTIKDIRIVYHKSGKPKGIAYVDFDTESAASKAVLKLDQFEYRGFTLNVAISAPPAKPQMKEAPIVTKLLGIRREPKARMNLIPTVIRKQSAEQNNKPLPEQKTNDDFRKFLQSMK